MNININNENILEVIQEKIAHILNISIFEVHEISDIDLETIKLSIDSVIDQYSHSFADRQMHHNKIYNSLTEATKREIIDLIKKIK